jgi:hypothetical protein
MEPQNNILENLALPQGLVNAIGTESRDFAIKAKRAQPPKVSLALIIFGAVWLAFTSIFVIAFLGPLFQGKEVNFLVNDVPTVAGPGNLKPILLPALIIGLFVFIGIIMLTAGFVMLFRKGGYFVGTPTRLISYKNGDYRSVDWEQFSGDIEVTGNKRTSNISLGMRTGKLVSNKNGPDKYVPDTLYISGITNAAEIERICRNRIKENDPTPAKTNNF